ncbi:MAG: protein kinase, partial [bacterium]
MSEKGFDQETVRRAGPASMGDAKTGGHEGAPLGRIDQYDLLCELGGGGFGSVYLARDTVAGVDVAVKGLPPMVRNNAEELERIRENFALVSKLHHPHIAAALHLHPAKEVSYADEPTRQKLRVLQGDTLMVMAYAPGVTLAKWRKQFPEGKVPAPQALEVCRQVAEALDYAHREKVVHRDVKPSNIMVESRVQRTEDRGQRAEYPADLRPPTSDLSVKVLDFGLAAEIRSSMSRVSQEKGDTSGTRPYMAPEQWAGKKQDGRTDQYALAVLFYELVSGAVPFASVFDTGDPVIMSNVVKTESPDPLALLTKAQNAALLRALAKEPAQRFLDCSAFVDALGGRDARGSSKVGRKAWLWLVVEAVVVAVSILYVSSIQSSNEKRAATARAAAASAALDVTQREKAEQARLAAENEKKRKQQEADVRIADEKRKKEDDAARIVEKRKQEALAAEQERLEKANVPAEAQARTVEWLGMSLMPVEAGSFSMGSSSGSTVEKSVHAVLISKLYWMGRTEVTQKQWREVMGDSPSHFKGDDLPVESVDWIRCLAFCEKLTEQEQKEGRLPEGYVYRLPTEAEWEYASRGGAKSRGYTYSGGNDIAVAGWYSDNSGSTTHPVGQKLANELG